MLMKKLTVTLLILSLAFAALAADKALDDKARRLLQKFESLQAKPDKAVPADVLSKARGIVLLDRTKAGFIFAYQGGSGVVVVRDKKNNWSPMAWVKADEASLGFQVGGQQSFIVVLCMNDESAKSLIADANFQFGGEARGTGGNNSAGVEGNVDSIERDVRVYDDREGVFGGVSVKGGAVAADYHANQVYYGTNVNMQDILFDKKVKPTETANALAAKIQEFSKKH
jgi:lipid-binding SYLF domain-containing protein